MNTIEFQGRQVQLPRVSEKDLQDIEEFIKSLPAKTAIRKRKQAINGNYQKFSFNFAEDAENPVEELVELKADFIDTIHRQLQIRKGLKYSLRIRLQFHKPTDDTTIDHWFTSKLTTV